jgi:hypothetical protein
MRESKLDSILFALAPNIKDRFQSKYRANLPEALQPGASAQSPTSRHTSPYVRNTCQDATT